MASGAEVKVERREAARGAGLRLEGIAAPGDAGRLWGRLYLLCANMPAAVPFGLSSGEAYEACWPLAPGAPVPEGLTETEMPGGWYASMLHEGPYDLIGETLRRIEEDWLPHGGFRRAGGPVVERYLNDPREVPEAELRTEVCLPVVPDPIE